jgi:uncharacterized protein YxeA
MKKVLIALVAIAVAVGFATAAFAEEAQVKVKEKVKITKTGDTKTKTSITVKTGKQGARNKFHAKILQYTEGADGPSVTLMRFKDETLNPATATKSTYKVHSLHANTMKTSKDKILIFSSDKVTIKELQKNGQLGPNWTATPVK